MEADESTSCVEFFRQSLYSEFWKYGTGRYWVTTHRVKAPLLPRASYLHITLGMAEIATFSL
jgi:hypothetical protein